MANDPKRFKYASPGVYTQEFDQTPREVESNPSAPCIITRTQRGPALRPVVVNSMEEFVEVFGDTVPGGDGGDVWRYGNRTTPMYGTFAAQAWLANSSPAVIVRLLGAEHQDASTTGKAGWSCVNGGATNSLLTCDGASAFFLVDSSSAGGPIGTLAAIFYLKEGSIALSGSRRDDSITATNGVVGTNVMVASTAQNEFTAHVFDENGVVQHRATFNFSRTSEKFIRNVFNCNPVLTNSTTVSSTASYWLGETFEREVEQRTSASVQFGFIVPFQNGSTTYNKGNYKMGFTQPKTGWVVSQDLSTSPTNFEFANMQKLFRFVGIDGGEWVSKNLKISIENIKESTNEYTQYGTFDVVVRKVDDSDNAVKVVERFAQCNLDPSSPSYISAKIGDMYVVWDDTERYYKEYGEYPNNSKYIRVDMNTDVDKGATNPTYLPFGFYGPPNFKGFGYVSGSTGSLVYGGTSLHGATYTLNPVSASVSGPKATKTYVYLDVGTSGYTGSFAFPACATRLSSSDGVMANPKEAYWGITTNRSGSTWLERSYYDLMYPLSADYMSNGEVDMTNGAVQYSSLFTLDDLVRVSSTSAHAYYISGSRKGNYSYRGTGAYTAVLDAGFDRFTLPLYGGFDGLDITEGDPFRNSLLDDATGETDSYAHNSVKRAIDSVADEELVDLKFITMPGLTDTALTDHMLRVAEKRADCLAIIDLAGDYTPAHENSSAETSRLGNIDTTISNLQSRSINTTYGCAYYPWVQVRDASSARLVWVPPSVVAIGAMAFTEKRSKLWFAPAGFNRGGLSFGAAGLPVINVRERLRSKDREKLYKAMINPIAKFPAEGIVIWGQKTLSMRPSALDRINVRRLMNYVKKELSKMAKTTIFEPNIEVTWNAYLSKAEPFLRGIKTAYGLEEFRLILDDTTTTQDLVDRNIIYAKVLLVPTKAAEQFYIDFYISNKGASFSNN